MYIGHEWENALQRLAGNKCQCCIEFRVMFRVELHFLWDFFVLHTEFHHKSYVNTTFLYEANLASYINSIILRRFNKKIKNTGFE